MKVQLTLFKDALFQYSNETRPVPKNWFEAFTQLKEHLQGLKKNRIVLFLDELPWLDTPRSNFLAAFSYFWNTWGSIRDGLKLVVCGCATSWMLENVVGAIKAGYTAAHHGRYMLRRLHSSRLNSS